MTAELFAEDIDALILRLKEAVYGAGVSRGAVETTWAECHKPRCPCTHGRPEDAFLMMKQQISADIEAELRWRVTSRPDVGEDGDSPAQNAVWTLAELLNRYNVRHAGTFVKAATLIVDAYPDIVPALTTIREETTA